MEVEQPEGLIQIHLDTYIQEAIKDLTLKVEHQEVFTSPELDSTNTLKLTGFDYGKSMLRL
jgi:hypothetical protein